MYQKIDIIWKLYA